MFHIRRPKRTYLARSTLVWTALLTLSALGLPTSPWATADVRDAMVKIYQVEHRPDYDNPWDRHGPQTSSGSGCIISGNRILTSAHVVSNTTFLQVQLGSRLAAKKVCMTRAQWEEQRRADQQLISKSQLGPCVKQAGC